MASLIVRRLLLGLVNIFLISILLYFAMAELIGNPSSVMLGQDATPQGIAQLNHQLGFDRSLIVQYGDWVGHTLRGDFGRSYSTGQPIVEMLQPALPVSFELAVDSVAVAILFAVFFNTLTVARGVVRPVVTAASLVGVTVPNFALGIALIYLFSVELGWLPTSGWSPWSEGVGAHLWHMILPVATATAYYFGSFGLVYRAEYRAVARRLFVQVARAKGLSESAISFRHVMPNSILPIITFAGGTLGQLVAGSVVTETVFSMPGVGNMFAQSILTHDFPVMLALGMVAIVGVVTLNLLADLLYLIADPRIRLA